ALAGALAAIAAAGAPAAPAAAPDPGKAAAPAAECNPRLTADLTDLTLPEAAEKLARLCGLVISVPDPERDPKPGAPAGPRLDVQRRARLSWTGVPLSDALRDFCRTYGCSLLRGFSGGMTVIPGSLPSGPSASLEGFSMEVTRVGFSDY